MNTLPSPDHPLWAPVPHWQPPPPELLRLLHESRAALDLALAANADNCQACGQCCDFPRQGHILFATKLELDAVIDASRRQALITPQQARQALDANLCPFWHQARCRVHTIRPFGCRTFFCTDDQKNIVTLDTDNLLYQYRSKLKGHIGFHWYGPALTYWRSNVISFLADS